MVASSNWLILGLSAHWVGTTLKVSTVTDIPCHLTLLYRERPPKWHKRIKFKRGMPLYGDPHWGFEETLGIDQEEPGDTFLHSHLWPGWQEGQQRYWTFTGTVATIPSPSGAPFWHITAWEDMMEVISISKYGEAEFLSGNVKLEQGSNITITRDPVKQSFKFDVPDAALQNVIWLDVPIIVEIVAGAIGDSGWQTIDLSPSLPASARLVIIEVAFALESGSGNYWAALGWRKTGTAPGLWPTLSLAKKNGDIAGANIRGQFVVGMDAAQTVQRRRLCGTGPDTTTVGYSWGISAYIK